MTDPADARTGLIKRTHTALWRHIQGIPGCIHKEEEQEEVDKLQHVFNRQHSSSHSGFTDTPSPKGSPEAFSLRFIHASLGLDVDMGDA